MVRSKTKLYEGKAKIIFEGYDPFTLIQYFKDDITAFNNKKSSVISGKGILNNRISEFIMLHLEEIGIPTHFIKSLNMREQLIKKAEMLPIEVIVRNFAAGSFVKRYGIEQGTKLMSPVTEFTLKKDSLGDPVISEDYILSFGITSSENIEEIRYLSSRVNDFLYGLFSGIGIKLIDFKMEFGIFHNDDRGTETLILADEISPDSCRLWEAKTNEKFDKDVFRLDLGNVADAYKEVAKRLGIYIENEYIENEGISNIFKK